MRSDYYTNAKKEGLARAIEIKASAGSLPEGRPSGLAGYNDASVMRNGLVKAGARFLSKPYRGGQLAATVRALLDA